MNKFNFCDLVDGLALISTYLQTDETLRIIQGVLTAISIIIGVAYRLWVWYRNAKKDGKIDEKEVGQLIEGAKETLDEIGQKFPVQDNEKKKEE